MKISASLFFSLVLLSAALALAASPASAIAPRTPIATFATGVPETVVAAQNGIIVVGSGAASTSATLEVYQVGTWALLATLSLPSSNVAVSSIAIQNGYIAAGIVDFSNNFQYSVCVFQKAQGGWSNEGVTATLSASSGASLGSTIAAWGNTLIAASEGVAYIFIEPDSGWVNATEYADLTASDAPSIFGGGVAITGSVGSGGSLAAVGSSQGVYVFVEPKGGWTSMTQTAELAGNGYPAQLSAAKSSIAFTAGRQSRGEGEIYIYDEPEGGWMNASSPNFTATADNSAVLGVAGITLSQDAQVLAAGIGSSNFQKPDNYDRAYLWHADKDFGSSPIKLSTTGLSTGLYGATVAEPYAYAYDRGGNIFVFDGK
jgi:hypothetical protein